MRDAARGVEKDHPLDLGLELEVLEVVVRDRPDIGLIQLRAGRSLIDLIPVDSELIAVNAAGDENQNVSANGATGP